ncbi:MAG: F0F1 ATP synthase subunit B [Acidimicrobiales bacterium]
MRFHRPLLALAATLALGVGLAGPVAAQEESPVEEVIHEAEENGAAESDAECIEVLAEGGALDDCYEAPNQLLPEPNEIIWGAIGFVVVLLFISRFGLPAIKAGMNARTERIRTDLNQAESVKNEADQVLSEYRAQLADAKAESGRIIEAARQQADTIKTEQEERLKAELATMREQATADVTAAKTSAIADLRDEVASLAIGAAEVVVQRNLDRDTQTALVEQYIAQVASRSN